jgi:hypothetical protein
MTLIGFAGEDEDHFRIVTTLVDDALVSRIDWLRGILDSCRTWAGLHAGKPWYKYAPEDAYDVRPFVIEGMTIKPQGWIAGEPLKREAGMWRRILLLFCHADPRPDLVVLVRDLDGCPERRAGIEQVRNGFSWPFPIVVAAPEPEIEGWIVSGFVAATAGEQKRLDRARRELSFDPTIDSHRLTSHPNAARTDAKYVLSRLCLDDREREQRCLERALLHQRGEHNGAREFLEHVHERILPVFGSRPE